MISGTVVGLQARMVVILYSSDRAEVGDTKITMAELRDGLSYRLPNKTSPVFTSARCSLTFIEALSYFDLTIELVKYTSLLVKNCKL